MRTKLAYFIICTGLAACNTIPEPVLLAEAPTCVTRETATGSNYLKRVPCVEDTGDHREAREHAEAIRDDQRSRELSRMQRGS